MIQTVRYLRVLIGWLGSFRARFYIKTDLIPFKSFSCIFSTQTPEPIEIFSFSSSETPINFQSFPPSNLLPFVSYFWRLFTSITVGCPLAALGTPLLSFLFCWSCSYFSEPKVTFWTLRHPVILEIFIFLIHCYPCMQVLLSPLEVALSRHCIMVISNSRG